LHLLLFLLLEVCFPILFQLSLLLEHFHFSIGLL
jgi:hypothetical protein